MNITKRDAFRAGWPTTVKDGYIMIRLTTTVALAALYAMTGGLSRWLWLTAPPETTPLWVVWVTRVLAIAVIIGIPCSAIVLFVNLAIASGRKKLRTDTQQGKEEIS